jgi:hypothetical protein
MQKNIIKNISGLLITILVASNPNAISWQAGEEEWKNIAKQTIYQQEISEAWIDMLNSKEESVAKEFKEHANNTYRAMLSLKNSKYQNNQYAVRGAYRLNEAKTRDMQQIDPISRSRKPFTLKTIYERMVKKGDIDGRELKQKYQEAEKRAEERINNMNWRQFVYANRDVFVIDGENNDEQDFYTDFEDFRRRARRDSASERQFHHWTNGPTHSFQQDNFMPKPQPLNLEDVGNLRGDNIIMMNGIEMDLLRVQLEFTDNKTRKKRNHTSSLGRNKNHNSFGDIAILGKYDLSLYQKYMVGVEYKLPKFIYINSYFYSSYYSPRDNKKLQNIGFITSSEINLSKRWFLGLSLNKDYNDFVLHQDRFPVNIETNNIFISTGFNYGITKNLRFVSSIGIHKNTIYLDNPKKRELIFDSYKEEITPHEVTINNLDLNLGIGYNCKLSRDFSVDYDFLVKCQYNLNSENSLDQSDISEIPQLDTYMREVEDLRNYNTPWNIHMNVGVNLKFDKSALGCTFGADICSRPNFNITTTFKIGF